MSINRIMSNGYMGMTAQSRALGSISDNVANARTIGYKTTDTLFQDFVAADRFGRLGADSAGVRTSDRLEADKAGSYTQTQQTTNAAISGRGFFMVQELDNAAGDAELTSDELVEKGNLRELTRAGDFTPDQYGHLVNSSGRALLGIPITDGDTASVSSRSVNDLELVSLDTMSAVVAGTTQVSVAGNLPTAQLSASDATPENGMSTTVKVVDKEGTPAAVTLTFKRTALNTDGSSTWEVSQSGARYEDGSVSGSDAVLGSIGFRPNGDLDGTTDGATVSLPMSLAGNFDAITLDLGKAGTNSGMRNTPGVGFTSLSYGQNGITKGSFREVEITDKGVVRAHYADGQSRDFYRIPNAIVANSSDLEAVTGTAFRPTEESGAILLRDFGSKGQTTLTKLTGTGDDLKTVGASLMTRTVEESNTNLENQFTNLILTQRAYSANSKSISTADEMTQTVLGLKA